MALPRKLSPRIVLPVALAATALSVAGCSDDESGEELASCESVQESMVCQICMDSDGDRNCAGTPACFYDSDTDTCDEAIA